MKLVLPRDQDKVVEGSHIKYETECVWVRMIIGGVARIGSDKMPLPYSGYLESGCKTAMILFSKEFPITVEVLA
jgi:hypothetical protein